MKNKTIQQVVIHLCFFTKKHKIKQKIFLKAIYHKAAAINIYLTISTTKRMIYVINRFYPEGWIKNTPFATDNTLTIAKLSEAITSQKIMEGIVKSCDTSHNLIVNLGGVTGIIPRNEGALGICDGSVRDIALISRVGKPVCFTVSSIETETNGKHYAVLSRSNAQRLCKTNFINQLSRGDIIDAKITHLDTFGAFCDIGCGTVALLPIDSISVSRISHPKDRFYCGQNIKAVIKEISSDGKITLSHKELLGTWEENARKISQGETVSGIVRSVEDYGIFVELTPNLAGLAEPKIGVEVGQKASVYIKSIIPEKMKVKLVIIDSFKNSVVPEIVYYCNDKKITHWRYSPASCSKNIETVF